jgi:hypothetical protein
MKDMAVLVGNPLVGIMAALAISWLIGGRVKADPKKLLAGLQKSAARIVKSLGLTHDAFPIL